MVMACKHWLGQGQARRPNAWRAHRPTACHSAAPRGALAVEEGPARRSWNTRRQLLLGSATGALSSCLPGTAISSQEGSAGACIAASSPIDIPLAAEQAGGSPLPPIKLKYPRFVKGTVINTGQGTPQVNMPDNVLFQLGGDTYRLVEFHFCAPSEHAFDGKHAAMEVQLVHRHVQTGELCVLAVMLQPGAVLANPCLDAALSSAPPQPGVEVPLNTPISLLSLLPKPRSVDGRRPYATYTGSLTQPPCTAGVRWIVFLDSLRVPASQLLDFLYFGSGGRTMALNARPAQPLGNRHVEYFV